MSEDRGDARAQQRGAAFGAHRGYLVGVAYRMLGSVAEAEDVVQDAFLRWQLAEDADVVAPRAYLSRVVARLRIDPRRSPPVSTGYPDS